MGSRWGIQEGLVRGVKPISALAQIQRCSFPKVAALSIAHQFRLLLRRLHSQIYGEHPQQFASLSSVAVLIGITLSALTGKRGLASPGKIVPLLAYVGVSNVSPLAIFH